MVVVFIAEHVNDLELLRTKWFFSKHELLAYPGPGARLWTLVIYYVQDFRKNQSLLKMKFWYWFSVVWCISVSGAKKLSALEICTSLYLNTSLKTMEYQEMN